MVVEVAVVVPMAVVVEGAGAFVEVEDEVVVQEGVEKLAFG